MTEIRRDGVVKICEGPGERLGPVFVIGIPQVADSRSPSRFQDIGLDFGLLV